MIAGTLEIQMMANFARLIEDVRQVQQKVDAGMSAIERSVGLASRALGGLAAGFSVTKLVSYADAWGQLSSRMTQATGSATAGEAAMSRLMDVSNRVYKPIADTAELFIRTSESLKQMGYTTAETVDMVETLSYGLTVSSASADKTKSVIDAWSKSMLQGKMTMGEYQTVISGAPALQKALADALGLTIAGLQDMVGKGQLSADKLMLVTKQMQELGKQADAMPVTVTDAFTKLVNNVTQYAGELNKSTGATSLLTGAIGKLADNVGPLLTMLATMVGLAVASWLTTVVSGAVAAGGAFTAAALAVKGFMASLGPLGWLVLAVGAGTAAYQAFKSKAEEAGRASQEAAAAAERAWPRMLAGLTPALDALNKKLDDYIAKKKQAMGVGPTDIEALGKEYSDANKKIEEAGRALHALSGRMDAEAQGKRTAILKELADETVKLTETDKKIAEARKVTVNEYLADTGRMTDAQRKSADIAKENARYEEALGLAQGDAGRVAQITAAHQTALGEIRSKYSKQSVADSKQEEKSYLSLLDAINAKIAEEKLERQSSEALTESQRLRIKLQAELKKNITSDHKTILESKLKELEVEEGLTAAFKKAAEARKAWQEQQKQNVDAAFATASSLEEGNKQLREEIALIGKSKKEQEAILRVRREQVIAVKEAELATLQAKESFDVYDTMMIQALQEQIEQLKERNKLLGQKEVAEETASLVQSQKGNWAGFFQSIDQTAQQTWTNVFEDGAGTFKRLGQTLKSAVLDMLYQLTIRKWVINIGASLFGDGSSAMTAGMNAVLGAGGGGGGMFSNISSGLSGANALGLLGTFGGGMSAGFGGLMGSLGLSATGTTLGGAMSAGTIAMQSGNILGGLGTFLGALGPIVGGLSLLFGGDIFGSLFGRKLKESGVEGDFGGDSGFEGRLYKFYKGGAFRSNKTRYEELPEEMRSALGNQFLAMDESIRAMAGAVGLGGEALDGFTAKIKVNLKGLSEEEATKKLQEEFQKIADQMGGLVLTSEEYTRAGETQLEALTRLSASLSAVNGVFDVMGATLLEASLASADWASTLIDLMGGLEGFAAAAKTYYDLYYSDDEKRAQAEKVANRGMEDMGLDLRVNDDNAKARYRQLVDDAIGAQDETLLAWLLNFSDEFAAGVEAWTEGMDIAAKAAADAAQAAKDAAEEAAEKAAQAQKDAIDAAYDLLSRAIDRDRSDLSSQASVITSTINTITSAVRNLRSAANDLYGTVDSTAQMAAAQGMVYIERALAGMRMGGSLVDYDGLSDAISAARSGIKAGAYTSMFERDRDALVLAGQLDELGDLGDQQLTFEERQLKAINQQIEYLDALSKKADELINGTVQLTGTVDQYFAELLKLLTPEEVSTGTDGGAGGRGAASFGGGGGYIISGGASESMFEGYLPDGRPFYKDGSIGTAMDSTQRLLEQGIDPYSNYPGYSGSGKVVLDASKGLYVPGYAAGGFHAGGFRVVGENGPELEATGPARIWNAQQTRSMLGGGGDLAAAVETLSAQVEKLVDAADRTAANTAGLPSYVDQRDNMSEGGNADRVEIMNPEELAKAIAKELTA